MNTRTIALAGVLILFTLTGAQCATTSGPEPVTVTKTVYVPTPVRCTPNIGPTPAYPDTDAALKAAPDLLTWGKLLVAGRIMRIAREGQLLAAVNTCEGGQ